MLACHSHLCTSLGFVLPFAWPHAHQKRLPTVLCMGSRFSPFSLSLLVTSERPSLTPSQVDNLPLFSVVALY